MAASIRMGSSLRGHAYFLTVHSWIKALQELKEPSTVGRGVTDGFHEIVTLKNIVLVSSFVPGARAVTVALSLG